MKLPLLKVFNAVFFLEPLYTSTCAESHRKFTFTASNTPVPFPFLGGCPGVVWVRFVFII